jgi:hypothetical protein
MALGHRDSAETVLRSVVSVGFAFIDNGSSPLEGLMGNVIVGIGRDALHRFYVIQHDPRAALPALRPLERISGSKGAAIPQGEVRRRLLARIEDPSVPLGIRFEALQSLSISSCTNVRELVLGPGAEVTDALGRARRTVARYPSERALLDLQARIPGQLGDPEPSNPVQALAISSATVAGTVLQNPRLAACTRLLVSRW